MKNNNKGIHPVWFFILLSFVTILLSSILSIFNIQGNEMTISLANYKTSTSVVAVESLLSFELRLFGSIFIGILVHIKS